MIYVSAMLNKYDIRVISIFARIFVKGKNDDGKRAINVIPAVLSPHAVKKMMLKHLLNKNQVQWIVEWKLQHVGTIDVGVESEWKDDVDERGDESIKLVELYPGQATWRKSVGQKWCVRCTRRQGTCGNCAHTYVQRWTDFEQSEESGSIIPQPYSTEVLHTFANHVRARSELRDPNVHHELQADLVKHIWTKFGMFHD
ncbi:hypothetical protein MTR_8g021110 [Medicago truncatula]|uniref:Uncharacterized protein n=1 Tax=Medicago truncatula TaxID=3880 RepID=G7L7L1_MEDTR|nr:hypothetical protein MTR_8g021110 [Medicago truncatula]